MDNFLYRHNKYLKYLLLLSLITFAILFVATTAHGAWYDSNWQWRKQIKIDGSKVSGGPYTSFPLLIQLASDADLAADAQIDGDDILFTSSDEVTKIPHEIESFNSSTGALVAWVKVSLNANPTDTIIYMYYGYGSATNQQDATNVWDSNYAAVWHLDETSGDHADSTSNNNTGTPSGGVNQNGTGQIDGADVFDGSSGYVQAPDYDILNAITISAWINWDGVTANTGGIVSKRTSTEVLGNWDLRFYDDGRLEWMLWSASASSQKLFSNSAFSSGTLKHVAVTFDDSTNTAKIYIDGAFESQNTSFTNSLADTPQQIHIGWGGQSSQYYGGTIDELRLSKVARSADWIKTSYNNQAWPNKASTPSPDPTPNPDGGFITVYSETTEGGVNPCGTNLVMVTVDGTTTGGFDDSAKRALFESWGWTVTAIADEDSQATFDNAAANNDVMFISESADSTVALSKARDLAIGIVVEESWLWDEMNFATSGDSSTSTTSIYISNSSHYITSPFSTGSLTIYTASNLVGYSPVSLASGGQVLATTGGDPTLFVFDTGAALTSGTAADRRVGFPTSESYPSAWNADIKTLLQRSLDWAAGCGVGGNPCGTNLVMVTQDGTTTTDPDDTAKKALFESWGWTVTSIDAPSGDYSGAASSNDVMFISESADSSSVGTQATNLNIGIVVEEAALQDEMELCGSQNYTSGATGTQIDIVDNTHYIASTLSTGPLTIYSTTDSLIINQATPAPGAVVVAEEIGGSDTALVTIDTGETLDNGAGAVNRRVGFTGMHESTPSNWTTSMETLVKRSLDWAAGCGAGGGTNLVPAAGADSFTTDEDVNLVDNVLTNDTLGDAPNTVSEVSGVSNGVLTLNADGSFTYDPDVGFSGTDSFTYRLTDNDSETSEATVTITVTAAGTPPPNLEEYSCNMKITINSAQVAGDLNDFPVLINLTDDSLKTSGCGFMTDPDGDDIVFTDSSKTTALDHEIEKYDETTGELVAWVKVPFVSGSSNTDIYLYFGNSNVTSPQNNPIDVWDSNYKGVWHLKEDAASATPVTIDQRIEYDADDSEESSGGSIDWGSSDLELVNGQQVGMRWRNLAIPQGATITSAYIEFAVDETDNTMETNLTFRGEDVDNAAVFENIAGNISDRINRTSASVNWNIVDQWAPEHATYQSPDISSIIQEIVDRTGWASGNALVVIVTGSGERTAESHEGGSSSYAPLLHVEYTTGVTDFHLDSTSNDNDGIPNGNTLTASGKIDGAQDFDGTNDWIKIPHSSSLNLTGDYSVELWVNYDTWEQWDYLIGKGDDNNSDVPVAVQFWEYSSRYGTDYTDSSNNWCGGSADSNLSSGNWYHITVTYNASTNALNFYLNGQADGNDSSGCNPGTNTLSWGIGADGVGQRVLNGRIDEVRISNTIRSAAWIETSYNNQNSPSSFYSVEKNCPTAAPPISEFTCSIPITILGSNVSGTSDLINFPVLISLTDIGLKTTSNCGYVEYSNGYDIIFSDATQTVMLDHEIEKYDGGSGELVAWVRVPTLSATSDTTIYLHFGRSVVGGACEQTENPTGVWDSNYVGVWHLDDTSGDTQDSTSYNTDGVVTGASRGSTGKIGDAFNFYTSDEVDWGNPADDHLDADTGSWTVSLWANIDTNRGSGAWEKIINKGKNSWETGYEMELDDTANNLYWAINDGSTEWGRSTSVSFSLDIWTHFVGVVDRTNDLLRLYKNGSQVDTSGISGYGDINQDNTDTLTIGKSTWGWPDARIDEVRLSKTARSADWIQTSYNNQSDPSSFYSVGASSCLSLSGFSCSRKITIDSSKVQGSSDLINFPLLIRTQNDCNLKTAANGGGVQNINGWDIIFVDSDGTTQLDHEIEEYDGTSGDLTAWVRVPTLPYNSDKDIYMYYGKSGLTCNPSNPTGVWDSSYEAVYHLNDDFEDSTSHNRDATAEDTGDYSAVIADGEDFGPQDEIAIGNWNFSGDELTLQAWARFDDFDQDDPRVFSKANGTSEQNHVFMLGLGGNLDQHLRMRVKTGTDDYSGTTTIVDTDDPLSSGNWYLITGTYDGSNMRLLLDGVQVHSAAKTGNLRVNSWDIALGNHPGNTSSTYTSLDGKLDEVRILSAARSADWLRTEYNNQSDPDSFYSMSQDTCGGEYGFNYQYCKKITVDHTQVSGSLTRYPLLINITGDDDLKTVANGGRIQNSQGWDIVFKTSGCVNYDHEIEKYDGVNGDLVAWVQIPTLSSSTDTEIYMYYGANVICDTSNPTAVWDARFRGVYHLNDDFQDSTQYNHDGTNNGATFAASKIGNGALFDPSDGYDYIDLGTWDMSTDDITLQAWVWPNDFNQGDPRVVTKCSTSGSGAQDHVYMLSLYNGDNGENRMRFRVKTGTDDLLNTTELQGTSPNGYLPTAQNWYFLAGTYENDVSPQIRMYRDEGLDAGTMNHSLGGDLRQNSWPVWIGASPYGSSNTNYSWDGILDEVRILSSDLSQDWLATEYRNHNDPGNFYSITSCFEQTTEVTQEWVEEVQQ